MAALFRKGLRSLIRTPGSGDNPPAGQRALLATTTGWVDRQSDGTQTSVLDVRLTGVYVTADWATDPNNPANGGTLPAGVPVLET